MSDDYGYFGKGIDGYVHYMQTVGESNKGGGGGKPPSGNGCLTLLIQAGAALIAVVFIVAVLFLS